MPAKGVSRVGGPGSAVDATLPTPLPRRRLLAGAVALALGAVAGCGAGGSDGVDADGRVTVELWHGQVDTGREAVRAL